MKLHQLIQETFFDNIDTIDEFNQFNDFLVQKLMHLDNKMIDERKQYINQLLLNDREIIYNKEFIEEFNALLTDKIIDQFRSRNIVIKYDVIREILLHYIHPQTENIKQIVENMKNETQDKHKTIYVNTFKRLRGFEKGGYNVFLCCRDQQHFGHGIEFIKCLIEYEQCVYALNQLNSTYFDKFGNKGNDNELT